MLDCIIKPQTPIEELTRIFLERGGRINKYYLRDWHRNKQTVVYLNGWFSGKNIRQALTRALA